MKPVRITFWKTLGRTAGPNATILLLAAGLLSGCASDPTSTQLRDLTSCPDERPQMCTREYNPVCAQLTDNTIRTYATGCTACADASVIGWVAGECPSPD